VARVRIPAMPSDDTSGVRVPPWLYYIAGFLAGAALEIAFPIEAPSLGWRLVAGALGFALWLSLDGRAMRAFARAGTSMNVTAPTSALVTSGPYRYTRNPMYVGMAFLYAGLAVALGVIWALATLPIVLVVVDRLVIAREEPYLEARFGDPYREYKQRVHRWL
jgi:protein-S-isoprenylcysteine O-methyltransferase Ste14